MFKFIGFIIFFSLLIGCGGGGGSSSSNTLESKPEASSPKIQRNLAAASNGATVVATYDNDSAVNVIDEVTSESLFWSANITDDSLTIDFGQISHVSYIDVYSTEMFLNSSRDRWVVELSENGSSWKRTMVFGGSNSDFIYCREYHINSLEGYMRCTFDIVRGNSTTIAGPDARYLRLTVTNPNAAEVLAIRVFEIVVNGK